MLFFVIGSERSTLCKKQRCTFNLIFHTLSYLSSLPSQSFKLSPSTDFLSYGHLLCVMGNNYNCKVCFYALWTPQKYSTKFFKKLFDIKRKHSLWPLTFYFWLTLSTLLPNQNKWRYLHMPLLSWHIIIQIEKWWYKLITDMINVKRERI